MTDLQFLASVAIGWGFHVVWAAMRRDMKTWQQPEQDPEDYLPFN